MEISRLVLCITQQDVDKAIGRWLPPDGDLKELSASIMDDGIEISGKHGIFRISIWLSVTVRNGGAIIQIEKIKTPLGFGKGKVLSKIKESLAGKPGVRMDGESIRVDVDRLIAVGGIQLRSNLSAIRTAPGKLTVECSN